MKGVSGAGFQVVKKVECSLVNVNYQWISAYFWSAFFGVFLCTFKMNLQNSACKDSVGCLSQWV